MKKTGVILLLAILAASLSQVWAEEKEAAKDEKAEAVKKLDAQISQAMVKGDFDLLDKHTAKDYMVIDPLGKVWNKQQNLDALKAKKFTFESIKDSDVIAHVHGDTAVLTGLASVKGKTKDHDVNGDYRWTRVYVMRDGDWKCLVEQLTHVYTEEKPKEK